MSIENLPEIPTVSEYMQIISKKDEKALSSEEESKKKVFEAYIEDCEFYENQFGMLSQATSDIYHRYKDELRKLQQKEKPSKLEVEVLEKFKRKMENKNIDNNYTRKLTNKSGYINAIVILVMILNIGFIIAMALLGNK